MTKIDAKVNVWDTYVTRKDGQVMHFDIITPHTDSKQVYEFGREYLKTKGQAGQLISSEQCKFCHVETVRTEWNEQIMKKGYFVFEMEGC